ncbi:recombinase family protein [Brevibacillus panacihumi]|uniref:recombinase family protein n=1 Tax=Brevibacillus panacihumi TaxID=497735 RepID=UPI003D248731
MRAALYIRVSTEDQVREGFSIAAQRERLLAYLHSQSWELSDFYTDEGVSAKDLHRPELTRLLDDVRRNKMDVVLVYRLDRLTRSVLDLYQLLQTFDLHGVHFKSCTEVYDTTTAIGRLFITLVAALAQWERENLAERVKMGMGQMVRERKRPGGPPPYGYALQDGQLQIQHDEACHVRLMFERYAQGHSPRQIAEEVNLRGARGKNGASWSASAVLRLLKNPVYYGALRWNYAHSAPHLRRQRVQNDFLLEEAVHPAIIDEPTFQRVQQRMAARGSRHPRVLGSSFLFSGILYCARCHAEMRGKTTHSKGKSGNHYTHTYYSCSNKGKGLCNAAPIREDRLEQALLQKLQESPPESNAFWQKVSRDANTRSAFPAPSPASDAKWEDRRRRWEEAYEAGVLTLGELRKKLQDLEKKQLAEKEKLPSLPHMRHEEERDEQQSLAWNRIWSESTREERRQLATSLIQRVEVEASPAFGNRRGVSVQQILFMED